MVLVLLWVGWALCAFVGLGFVVGFGLLLLTLCWYLFGLLVLLVADGRFTCGFCVAGLVGTGSCVWCLVIWVFGCRLVG